METFRPVPRRIGMRPPPAAATPVKKVPGEAAVAERQTGVLRATSRSFELKGEIHRKLISVLDLNKVNSLPRDRVRTEIGRVVEKLLQEQRVPMTTAEENQIIEEVLDEVFGAA